MTTNACEKSCHTGLALLTNKEITEALSTLSHWLYCPEKKQIQRQFSFKSFTKALAFVNAVAWIAQQENHHPDITFGYNYVLIAYQTHKVHGVTQVDTNAAKKVNALLNT